MGDSDLVTYFSFFTLIVAVASIALAAVAWRTRNRRLRLGVGAALLIVAAGCLLLSFAASLLTGGLGFTVLILGIRTPRTSVCSGKSCEARGNQGQ